MSTRRRTPGLAILTQRPPRSGWRSSLAGSVLAHALLLFVFVNDWTCAPDQYARGMGGPGPRGGGGGGGGEVVGFMQLPAYVPPTAEVAAVQPEPERNPEDIVITIPTPQIVDVPPSELALRQRQRINIAQILGAGEGTGGGAGRGTGSGGGEGSGVGTGIGSDRGPGTGGDGGDVFSPSLRYFMLPPGDAPSEVRGRDITIRVLVRVDGTVARILSVEPAIRNASFRRSLLEVVRQYRFNPATTRDGTPVQAEYPITITF